MLARDERRFRYRECLELEALHGQFLPCEIYDDLQDRAADGRLSGRASGLVPIIGSLMDWLRTMRETMRTS